MFAKALVMGALALVAAAQSSTLSFGSVPKNIVAGEPQRLTYVTNDDSTPVSIILRKGQSTNLDTLATLTDDAKNGVYEWTPEKSLVSATDYALEIKQGDQVNYYGPFAIEGGSAESSSSSSASASSSSASHKAPGYATITASNNGTAVATATASVGTGTGILTMSRNTTMSRPTLSRTSSASETTGASNTQSTEGAGFQGSQTGTGGTAQSTGGAAALMATGSSAIALVFGAVAAVFFF